MDYRELNGKQLDALREIANIGAGNAATALSILLERKIDMTIPSLNIKKIEDLTKGKESETEVESVLLKVKGDISGSILVIFENRIALEIINSLAGIIESEITEFGISVLSEIGNIISAAYMNSISLLTQIPMNLSVPGVASDMLMAIVSTIFVDASQYDEYILDIESIMYLGDKNEGLGVHFYFIPNSGFMEKLLSSIGLI